MAAELKKQHGQSLFEFMVFVPFFILLLISLLKFGSSINGSINQQKAVRSYFFYLIKNNSTLPLFQDLGEYRDSHGFGQPEHRVSFSALGWRMGNNPDIGPDAHSNETSYSPCYELSSFTNASFGETCGRPGGPSTPSVGNISQFIRIYTVFGLCSASYILNRNREWEEDFTSLRSRCIKTGSH